MKLKFALLLHVLMLVDTIVLGENGSQLLISSEEFSEAAVSLPLPGDIDPSLTTFVPASSAERIFGPWGITLKGDGATRPVLKHAQGISINPPFDYWSILNSGEPNDGHPLIVDFDWPVRRFGFDLLGQADTKTLTAFNVRGEFLGMIDVSQETGWIGIETTDVHGISKLLIDYGDSEIEEEIDRLVVEFIESRDFELYIAHIGEGQAVIHGQPVSLRFTVRISNLQEETTEGVLDIFDSDGQPLPVEINSTELSSMKFSLDRNATLTVRSDGASELLTSGYILIRSDRPVSATVEYTVLDKTREIVTEAGISAIEPALRMVGPAATIAQLNLDTAVAIVNTANSFAEVTLFVAEDGSEENSTLELGPGEHRAGFLRELFPSLSEDFQGTIIVTSDVPIAATILRTKNGLPLASFQFDSLERTARR